MTATHHDEADQALHEKLKDTLTPGYQAEFDPEEADRAGAFTEDALSEADALASTDDMADLANLTGAGSQEPAFLDDDGPSEGVPITVTTTNAGKLYELRPGETVAQAAARKAREG